MKTYLLIPGILALSCQTAALSTADAKLFATFQTSESISQGRLDVNTESRLVQEDLNRESLKLNLKSLSESNSKDEFRLWVGFGLTTPRCFTLNLGRGVEKAMYYATKSKAVRERVGVKYRVIKIATPLASPKSGWRDFHLFLKNKGVDSPVRLTSEIEDAPDPDEEIIVIEAKFRGVYNMVFFPTDAKSPDGLKALEICRKIETEFNIRMGC